MAQQIPIGKPTGYAVTFKGRAEKDLGIRDALHKKLNQKLIYRAKNLFIDQVEPANSKDLESKSIADLAKTCDEYKKSSEVEDCEVTTQKTPPQVACPPPDKNISTLKKAAQDLKSTCDMVNANNLKATKEDGSLSPLWAQNIIGSDLARSHIAELEASGKMSIKEVQVGDIDAGFSKKHITGKTSVDWSKADGGSDQDHGTKVVNLINGKGEYSTGYKVNMSVLADGYTQPYIKAVDQVLSKPPEILNFEFHSICESNGSCGTDRRTFKRGLDALTHKTIVVAAAGNYYGKTKAVSDSVLQGTILVGSADPNGLVSDFSDEDPNVAILAPSDYYLYSPGVKGTHFSGTSGATPLVTGALANVKSILGSMSVWDAKILLKRTATPLSVTSGGNKKNGVGLLNAYKLVRVAEKLKAAGWPQKKIDLKDPILYDFKSEAKDYTDKANEILQKGTDCKSQVAALKLYRKAFLLNPEDSTSQSIADLLNKTGYDGDTSFYKSRDKMNLLVELNTAKAAGSNLISKAAARRNMKLLRSAAQ